MAVGKKIMLGDLLVEYNLITHDQLMEALKLQKERGERLGQTLVNLGFVTEQNILQVLEFQLGIPQISLAKHHPDPEVVKMVPENLVKRYKVIPVKKVGTTLTLAMADPLDLIAMDDIALATGLKVEPVIASSREIERTINRYFGVAEAVEKSFQDFNPGETAQELANALNLEFDDAGMDDAPVTKAVNDIFKDAIQFGASDIHIEPHEKNVRVRYRVDGMLRDAMVLPKQTNGPLVSRIKILAGMDISEKRVPQDGRIQIKTGMLNIDLRVSSLPTLFGEKIVIRILDKSKILMKIDEVGFQPMILQKFKNMIGLPYGMVLLTGPTGSGKTTTLYAALTSINNQERNIITVEDPVEYVIDGINQIQINTKAGLTFANGLRSILRQDPDVIMVGEIRDGETADIAVRAATTGHLVFATMHTNDAPGTLTRLLDMGIKPFQVASSVVGVVAQRLVRHICPECREMYEVPAEDKERVFLGVGPYEPLSLYRGKGCEACNHTGYKGRLALHEVLMMSPEIKDLIQQSAPAGVLRKQASQDGMIGLKEDGIMKVKAGKTTISEVMRVSVTEEVQLNDILEKAVAQKASDIHLTVGTPPIFRVNGRLKPMSNGLIGNEPASELTTDQLANMIKEILTKDQSDRLVEEGEVDLSLTVSGLGRFRVNVFRQKGNLAMALRVISNKIYTIDELNLPLVTKTLASQPNGLVLVTGPTGSGKSTSLAAMIDYINTTRSSHIITLEDPIEYLHQNKKSYIKQREIGGDTGSFAGALRAAMRQDPDVILVGEMRDLETIGIAITAAETGHLVFATLHTCDAAQTIDRIIDVFPAHQQEQIRVQLASVLQGIVAQQLLAKQDGSGRVAAFEILVATPAVRNLIREGKTHQIVSAIQSGVRVGMQTMDSSLLKLYEQGLASGEEVLSKAIDKERMQQMVLSIM